jgi:diketogulonate reductase-like aldo/keto reductase
VGAGARPTSKLERLEENLGALNVQLTSGDIDRIERVAPKGAASGIPLRRGDVGLVIG